MMLNQSDIFNARILIVDDQIANVQLLEQMLADAGYTQATSTTNPRDVCPLHGKDPFDLILLDVKMPGMDGFEVMQGLKDLNPDMYLSVIVLTAEPAHKLKALQAGAKDFVSKPFDLVEVKTRIYNMLEVRLLYKKLEEHNKNLEKTVQERTAELSASETRFRGLTELASDWYWEQNITGEFTTVSGPVFETLGLQASLFLGGQGTDREAVRQNGWREDQRQVLHQKIASREPFLDFEFTRTNGDQSAQNFRVSGEPMFDDSGQFRGYRGIGAEVQRQR
jgi:CheY-like chemotaxis protein